MTGPHPLRIAVLGSGSAGNATVISDGTTTILVDCGFSAREVSRRLLGCGIEPSAIDAVFVTHEHGDHTRGIEVLCRRHATSAVVYASAGTRQAAGLDRKVPDVVSVTSNSTLRLGDIEIVPFATSHDAAEPLGFRFERDGFVVGLMTDSGVLTDHAADALAGCSILAIESNHDVEMLEAGPYPWHLKRRIASRHGHMSNVAAADALERLADDRLLRVIAMHRSRTNNTAALAGRELANRLLHMAHGARVDVAAQDSVLDCLPPQGKGFQAKFSL